MGEAFLYGNGEQNLLNFRVIGSLVQPAAPKENMIWVKTDRAITKFLLTRSIGAWSQEVGSV